MTTTYKDEHIHSFDDRVTAPGALPAKIEVLADGYFVVDGESVDLRRKEIGAGVYTDNKAWYGSQTAVGQYLISVERYGQGAGTITETVISSYPAYVLWPDGVVQEPQAITGAHPLSGPAPLTQGQIATQRIADVEENRSDWLARLKQIYIDGMNDDLVWWAYQHTENSDIQHRSTDVQRIEIPNWWSTNCAAVAAAVHRRSWPSMTAAEIEMNVKHLEDLLAAGIIRIWYGVGLTIPHGSLLYVIPGSNPVRYGSLYVQVSTLTSGYSDTFSVASRSSTDTSLILVPRVPDYQWLNLFNFSLPTAGIASSWNPENPA